MNYTLDSMETENMETEIMETQNQDQADHKFKRMWQIIGAVWLSITVALGISMVSAPPPKKGVVSSKMYVAPQSSTRYLDLNTKNPKISQKIVAPAGLSSLNIELILDPNIEFTLRNPKGVLFQTENPSAMKAEFSIDDIRLGIDNQISINKPMAGAWILNLNYTSSKEVYPTARLELTLDGDKAPSSELKINDDQIEGQPIRMILTSRSAGLPLEKEATVNLAIDLVNYGQFKLYDNGNLKNGDVKAGDGIYSTLAPALAPNVDYNSYRATSTLNALVGQEKLEMKSSSDFKVYKKTARIVPKIVEEIAQDDNHDGLIDRLTFKVPIESIWKEGPSRVTADLQALSGKNTSSAPLGATYMRADQTGFTKSMKFATFTVSAEDIKQNIGVDGPYKIVNLQHVWDAESSNEDNGYLYHLVQNIGDAGYTRAYKIRDFSRPYLDHYKFISDRGIDTNGNGLFDQIAITYSVDSATNFDTSLEWNSESMLTAVPRTPAVGDEFGAPYLRSKAIQQHLIKGTNTFELIFDVRELGLKNLGGPFNINRPSVYPNGPIKGLVNDEDIKYPDPFGITKSYTGKLEGSKPVIK
jgi:hypothetical protein